MRLITNAPRVRLFFRAAREFDASACFQKPAVTALTLPESRRQWHVRIWSLSWPVILANITIPLVGIVDTAVMGRMPQAAYIGAVAVGATIFSSIYWILGFLRMGTTGLVAQALGASQTAEIFNVAARGLVTAVVVGALILALNLPLYHLAFWIFDASDQVETLAGTYFSIRIWGSPALMLYLVELGILFGLQKVRQTLVISLLLNLTNVALDIIFVLGFGWGVSGVAAATILAEWFAALTGLVIVARALAASGWDGKWPVGIWLREKVVHLFEVNGNLVIRSFFVQFPFFAFTVVAASLGDLVLAANSIIMQFLYLTAFGLDAFAHTAETLTGFAFGARKPMALRQATIFSLGWAVLIACLIAVVYALFGPFMIALLTILPEVRATAESLLPWAIAMPLVSVLAFHLDGVFIGTTRTRELRNSMFLAALVYAAVLWGTLEPLGNQGLWLAMMTFFFIRGVLLAVQYPKIERLCANR